MGSEKQTCCVCVLAALSLEYLQSYSVISPRGRWVCGKAELRAARGMSLVLQLQGGAQETVPAGQEASHWPDSRPRLGQDSGACWCRGAIYTLAYPNHSFPLKVRGGWSDSEVWFSR